MPYLIQLPNDVSISGYRRINSYTFETLFFSPSHNFVGTEEEFVKAGFGYKYIQIDRYTRRVIES